MSAPERVAVVASCVKPGGCVEDDWSAGGEWWAMPDTPEDRETDSEIVEYVRADIYEALLRHADELDAARREARDAALEEAAACALALRSEGSA